MQVTPLNTEISNSFHHLIPSFDIRKDIKELISNGM